MRAVELFKVRIRFERLFADPAIFENLKNLARKYLVESGIGSERAGYIVQETSIVVPEDDAGRVSKIVGTAPYKHHGKQVSSEYMNGANLSFEYVDFGSGLSTKEHAELWARGEWGPMQFRVREFAHRSIELELPELRELYEMLMARANPTSMASIELPGLDQGIFHAVVGFFTESLETLATADGLAVETYATRELSGTEKLALEKRLGRESSNSTVHLILSKPGGLSSKR